MTAISPFSCDVLRSEHNGMPVFTGQKLRAFIRRAPYGKGKVFTFQLYRNTRKGWTPVPRRRAMGMMLMKDAIIAAQEAVS